jgi:hypothetical protein
MFPAGCRDCIPGRHESGSTAIDSGIEQSATHAAGLISFLLLLSYFALGGTLHAAIAPRDQQLPHRWSGTTTTSANFPHSAQRRGGKRNSTSPLAFINRINRKMEIAMRTVRCFHTSPAIILGIILLSSISLALAFPSKTPITMPRSPFTMHAT